MKKSFTEIIERQEIIDKLIEKGYGQLIDTLLVDDNYTKKDKLNKSAACRELGWKPKQLEDALVECRSLLADLGFDLN